MSGAKRRSFEAGHLPKFMVVVDGTPECGRAIHFAARRCARTGATLVMLGVATPPESFEWKGVEDAMQAEAEAEAEAMLGVAAAGAREQAGIAPETVVKLGEKADAILEQAKALNLLEKLDWSQIGAMPIFPESKDDYGMGYQYYSTLMAWRKGAKVPGSWKDFYDAQNFPGKRALPDDPVYVLPTVLLGSGVPVDKLYPLDVDGAFRRLDLLKKDVSVWWKAGAQAPQLLRDNEVQYAVSYSGRVVGQEGIEYTFNQANLDLSFFTIVKGARPEDVKAAYKLLYEMSVPANQAAAAEVIAYTGNSPDLEPLLPKTRLAQFPTVAANKKDQFFNDTSWWFKNGDAVQKRWQEFILSL